MDPQLAKLLEERRSETGKLAYYSRLDGDPTKAAASRRNLARIREQISALVASGATK